jgi:ribonucleotide monophosphatase NagD (HAD superfamily)
MRDRVSARGRLVETLADRRGVIFDIDGVFQVAMQPVPGAGDLLPAKRLGMTPELVRTGNLVGPEQEAMTRMWWIQCLALKGPG